MHHFTNTHTRAQTYAHKHAHVHTRVTFWIKQHNSQSPFEDSEGGKGRGRREKREESEEGGKKGRGKTPAAMTEAQCLVCTRRFKSGVEGLKMHIISRKQGKSRRKHGRAEVEATAREDLVGYGYNNGFAEGYED